MKFLVDPATSLRFIDVYLLLGLPGYPMIIWEDAASKPSSYMQVQRLKSTRTFSLQLQDVQFSDFSR